MQDQSLVQWVKFDYSHAERREDSLRRENRLAKQEDSTVTTWPERVLDDHECMKTFARDKRGANLQPEKQSVERGRES